MLFGPCLMAFACLATVRFSLLWRPPGRFCSVNTGILDPVGQRGKVHPVEKLPINVSHFFIIGVFTGTSVDTFASEQNVVFCFFVFLRLCKIFFFLTYLYCIYFICSLFQVYFRHIQLGERWIWCHRSFLTEHVGTVFPVDVISVRNLQRHHCVYWGSFCKWCYILHIFFHEPLQHGLVGKM